MGILGSRMIWWEGQPHLVPLLDMVNCAQLPSNPSCRWKETVDCKGYHAVWPDTCIFNRPPSPLHLGKEVMVKRKWKGRRLISFGLDFYF